MLKIKESILFNKARNGDTNAAEQLIGLHRDALVSYLYKDFSSLSMDDIEDAVQIASIQVMRDISKTEINSSFKSWLYGIGKFRCLDIIRSRKEQGEMPEDTVDHKNLENDVVTRIDIKNTLNTLPEKMKIAFLLSLEGLTYEEIAEILSTSKANVASDIHRAREKLQKKLLNI